MTSKVDKLPLETEPVARDNNTILTLKRGDQTLLRLTQLIIVLLLLLLLLLLVSVNAVLLKVHAWPRHKLSVH